MSTNEDPAAYGERTQRAVGAQLRAEMVFRGLKQGEVAERSGIPTNTLGRYLNGKRPLPLPEMAQIARAIGIDLGTLGARVQERLESGDDNGAVPE